MKVVSQLSRATVFSAALALLAFSACTKKEAAPEAAAPQAQTAPVAQTNGAAPAQASASNFDCGGKADVTLDVGNDGDNLYFNKNELTVKAGQSVKVKFTNNMDPSSNMNHNWVLVKSGSEPQVANDSMQAGEAKDWVAEGPSLIAHTRLIKPKDSGCVVFTAPAAGDYPYICTYPGHSMTMKGVLHVK